MSDPTEQFIVLIRDEEEGSRAYVFTREDAAVANARKQVRSLERQCRHDAEETLPQAFAPDSVLIYRAEVDDIVVTVTRVVADQPEWTPEATRQATGDRVRELATRLATQVYDLEGLPGHPDRIPVYLRSALDAERAVGRAGMTAHALRQALQS